MKYIFHTRTFKLTTKIYIKDLSRIYTLKNIITEKNHEKILHKSEKKRYPILFIFELNNFILLQQIFTT